QLVDAVQEVPAVDEATATIGTREVPALSALNETLRQDYTADCRQGVDRWNRTLAEVGLGLCLPHPAFHRNVGAFRGQPVSPDGRLLARRDYDRQIGDWLPTEADTAHVHALMQPVHQPGRMAGWVAPPATGVHSKPVDFEYVRA